MGGLCVHAQPDGAASQVLMWNTLHFSVSGDPDAAPVQLHGCGTGTEREDSGSGHLLPCSRRQQHAAQLHRERRHHPAGPRGTRRLALRREREDQDVSPTSGSSKTQIWPLGPPPLGEMSENSDVYHLDSFRRGWFPFSYTRVISDNDGSSGKQLRVQR